MRKITITTLLAVLAVLFWEELLEILGEALHLVFELVEYLMDELFEETFDFTPRQSQFITVWTLFFVAVYFGMRLCQWLAVKAREAYTLQVIPWYRDKVLVARNCWQTVEEHQGMAVAAGFGTMLLILLIFL